MSNQLEIMYYSTMPWRGVDKADRIKNETPVWIDRYFANAPGVLPDDPAISGGLLCGGPGYRTKRPHGRSDWLILMTVGGAGVLRHGDEKVIVEPHTVVVLLDGAPHDYGTRATGGDQAGRWVFAFVHVRPRHEWTGIVNSWPTPWPGLAMLSVSATATWLPAWGALNWARSLLYSPLRRRFALAMNLLEQTLLWCDEANAAGSVRHDGRVLLAAEFAREHADGPTTMEALSQAAGLSPSRLTTLFREQMGESPMRYAERIRLERAGMLISSAGFSVQEAANAAGYADAFHFSKRFKKRLGQSPSAWRTGGDQRS